MTGGSGGTDVSPNEPGGPPRAVAPGTWGVLALVVGFTLVGLVVGLTRSAIPIGISGEVTRVGWVAETGYALGTMDVEGERYIIDGRVTRRIEVGQEVDTRPWSSRLVVDTTVLALRPSGEVLRVLALAVMTGVAVLIVPGRRRATGAAVGGPGASDRSPAA